MKPPHPPLASRVATSPTEGRGNAASTSITSPLCGRGRPKGG